MTTIASIWPARIEMAELVSPVHVDPETEVFRLFSEYGSPLYRFCRFTLGGSDEAEDIVQDTFLKLLQHLRAGGDRSNLRNRGCSRWRRTRVETACDGARVGFPGGRSSITAPSNRSMSRPTGGWQRAAVRALAPRDRLLLSLRAQGLSYREIGAAAGIRERSVGRLLARAVDRWKHAGRRDAL